MAKLAVFCGGIFVEIIANAAGLLKAFFNNLNHCSKNENGRFLGGYCKNGRTYKTWICRINGFGGLFSKQSIKPPSFSGEIERAHFFNKSPKNAILLFNINGLIY